MIRIQKRLLWLVLGLSAVMAGVLLAAFLQRVWVVQLVLDRALAGTDLVEARMVVDRVGLKSARFSDMVLDGGDWRLEADTFRMDYDWRKGRILLVELGSSRARLDVDAILAAPSQRTVDELADLIEDARRALPEIPFALDSVEWTILFREREERLWLEGEGIVSPGVLIGGTFSLEGAPGVLQFNVGREQPESPMFVSGHFETRGNPLEVADRYVPDWRERLPSSLGLTDPGLGAAHLQFRVEQDGLRLLSFEVDSALSEVGLTIRTFPLIVEAIDSHLSWSVGGDPLLSVDLRGAEMTVGSVGLVLDQLSAEAVVGRAMEGELSEVAVESDLVSGRISVAFSSPWPEPGSLPMGLDIQLDIRDLVAGGFEWEPIRVHAATDAVGLGVRLPRLAVLEAVWPFLEDIDVRVRLTESGVGPISATGRLGFPELSEGDSGWVAGPDLNLATAISGLMTDSLRVESSINLPDGGGRWFLPGVGVIETGGGAAAVLQFASLDELAADWEVGLGRTSFRSDQVQVELERIDLKTSVPSQTVERLQALIHAPLGEQLAWAGDVLVDLEVIGDRLEVPGGVRLEWFDLTGKSRDLLTAPGGRPAFDLSLQAANLKIGSEGVSSVDLRYQVVFDGGLISGLGQFEALFDGTPVGFRLDDEVHLDGNGQLDAIATTVTLDPLRLDYSDILARLIPAYPGLSVSGFVEGGLYGRWSRDQSWDAGGRVVLRDGSVFAPSRNLRMEGLRGEFSMDSFRNFGTPPDLEWAFATMTVADLEVRDGRVVFGFPGPDRVAVAELTFESFKGRFRTDPFVYFITDKSVEMALHVDGLDAGAVTDQLQFFNGRFKGTLNGTVPFRLKKGKIEPLSGHLELDGSEPAVLQYESGGLLTRGEVARGLKDKLRLYPLQLAENGLKNLRIDSLTVDLFDPAWPETPARVHLTGEAVTPEAVVPYVISVNVNGTVAEALNFLFRLGSL